MNKVQIASILGAAALAATLPACGSDDSGDSGSSSGAAVKVDDKEVDLGDKTVACAEVAGKVNIGVGAGTSGVGAVVSTGDDPQVESVGLGSVDGVTLGYQRGAGEGSAEVDKDGKTYTIKGEATGVNMSDPTKMVKKSYEIKVTCP
ncbi:lipoprotein LpqH [Gordonia paraffinivorans]|uniref:lipoprotein LpqH n=1 Tax=Gordonia paraffinivorans TaxID=175628 RepID=UPI001445EE0C|nr:lipoprotein LpqH [Gordonia paraffinivorans]